MSSDAADLPELPRLRVVGDSISMRYGPDLAGMLAGVARYSRKPAIDDDPESANGRDSGTVLAYLEGLAAAERADIDYLMVNCGLHDVKRDLVDALPLTSLEQYAANLRAIVEQARAFARGLIWVRTTPVIDAIHNNAPNMTFHRYTADVTAYNEAADAVMREAGACSIDLYGFTQSLGPDVYCDHVHFTPEVARLQAAFIAGCLSRIIT